MSATFTVPILSQLYSHLSLTADTVPLVRGPIFRPELYLQRLLKNNFWKGPVLSRYFQFGIDVEEFFKRIPSNSRGIGIIFCSTIKKALRVRLFGFILRF